MMNGRLTETKLVGTLAFIGDFEAAKAAWLQFTKSRPNDRLTWRHGTRVIREQPWTDKFGTVANV
jgi:hypothetical protein